jgi:hypothetical protein
VGGSGVNFALDDRHRSLRRFLMNALGSPPWTIRTERQPVADEKRPIAVVEVSAPAVTTRSRTSIPQGDVEKQQTFTLTLYPALGATGAEARLAAAEAAQLLEDAISVGLVNDDGTLLSAPEMLPVYDFAGVPVKGAGRAGPAVPYGWLRVEDLPVRPIQDPEDELRWTVVCDLRVSWEQAGRDRAPGAPVGSMPGGGTDWGAPVSPPPPTLGGGGL